jgi:hypothetical protein
MKMKKKVIEIIKTEYEQNKRYVPWDSMWDKAAETIVDMFERESKRVSNRQIIYVKKDEKK